jgi:hypothetical protein
VSSLVAQGIPACCAFALAALGACYTESEQPVPGASNELTEETVAAPLRLPTARLTAIELERALRDVFAPVALPPLTLAGDVAIDGFDNVSAGQAATPGFVEGLQSAVKVAVQAALANASFLGCKPQGAAEEDACARATLERIVPKAFRRPIAADELSDLVQVYVDVRKNGATFSEGLAASLSATLQMPDFVYRIELGSGPAVNGKVTLTNHEMASRLAFFLWDAPPDRTLLDAAQNGALQTPEQLETQARRMFSDPRAKEAVAHFNEQWLHLDKFARTNKDAALYPQFDAQMRNAMRVSLDKYIERAFFEEGSLTSLLIGKEAYVNNLLAPLYGVSAPGPDFRLVTLDPSQRSGLLTQVGVMAMLAHEKDHAPILRGVFVLDNLLCTPAPPPPKDIPPAPAVEPGMPKTTRERMQKQHTAQASCKGCHETIDGVGFTFENYDTLGQWRTTENGQPLDSSGFFFDPKGDRVLVQNAVELSQKLAESTMVRDCLTKRWYSYALGAGREDVKPGHIATLAASFQNAKLDMRELVIAMIKAESFRTRIVEQ